jgi:hypothetical protein
MSVSLAVNALPCTEEKESEHKSIRVLLTATGNTTQHPDFGDDMHASNPNAA